MKVTRAGFEGINTMHYEFINAGIFTITNKDGAGRNITKGKQIPQ